MEAPPIPDGFTTTQHRALGVNSALIALAVVMMAVRLYARLVVAKAMGSDDSESLLKFTR